MSLAAAAAAVTASTASDGEGAVDRGDRSPTGTAGAEVEGTWTVDTTTGDFGYESATGTFAGFRIEEELADIGATTAVGRTAT